MQRAEETLEGRREGVLADDPADRLLEESWSDRERRASRPRGPDLTVQDGAVPVQEQTGLPAAGGHPL